MPAWDGLGAYQAVVPAAAFSPAVEGTAASAGAHTQQVPHATAEATRSTYDHARQHPTTGIFAAILAASPLPAGIARRALA